MLRRIGAGMALVLLGAVASASATASTDNWARMGRPPLSDRAAAKLVQRTPEVPLAFSNSYVISCRCYYSFGPRTNAPANDYFPTDQDLRTFRSATTKSGKSILKVNPYLVYVTGRDYLRHPSTQDVIAWGAMKWGIPVSWMKALIKFESVNMQYLRGDLRKVSRFTYSHSPAYARVAPNKVYESLGIAQIKWLPNNSVNAGTQPLRWKSTAFSVDYLGATIRFFYDGKCTWCGRGYHRGDQWGSMGAWNAPIPWRNARKSWYISHIQATLANQRQ